MMLPTGSQRVLIAEDQPEMQAFISDALTNIGLDSALASDGDVAWQQLQQEAFALVITDVHMPTMSGLELLRKTREHGLKTPFILVSGRLDQMNFTDAVRHNASRFLSKPFTCAQLAAVIQDVLQMGRN